MFLSVNEAFSHWKSQCLGGDPLWNRHLTAIIGYHVNSIAGTVFLRRWGGELWGKVENLRILRFENLTTRRFVFPHWSFFRIFWTQENSTYKIGFFFQPDVTDRSTCCNCCMRFAELKCFSFMNPEDLGPRITIFARRGDVLWVVVVSALHPGKRSESSGGPMCCEKKVNMPKTPSLRVQRAP